MSQIILSEHDAFQRIIEGLELSADGARMMAAHDTERKHMWNKLAETYLVCREAAYALSTERASRTKDIQ